MATTEIQTAIQQQAREHLTRLYGAVPRYVAGEITVGDLMTMAQAADVDAEGVERLVAQYRERERLAEAVARADEAASEGNGLQFQEARENAHATILAPAKEKYREALAEISAAEEKWANQRSAGGDARRRFRDHLRPGFLREAADEIGAMSRANQESHTWRDRRRAVESALDTVTRRIADFRRELGKSKPDDADKSHLRKLENQRDELQDQLANINAVDRERERCQRLVRAAQDKLGELQCSHWPTPSQADQIVADLRAAIAE